MGRGDEGGAADLIQHVFDFAHTVCRIDRHQDNADPRGGELREQPFVAVRRPNTDPVALLEAELQKAVCQRVDLPLELGPGPTHVLFREDGRLAVGEFSSRVLEDVGDRAPPEFGAGRAHDMGDAALRQLIVFECGRVHQPAPIAQKFLRV